MHLKGDDRGQQTSLLERLDYSAQLRGILAQHGGYPGGIGRLADRQSRLGQCQAVADLRGMEISGRALAADRQSPVEHGGIP
jgi:hypothetical protein